MFERAARLEPTRPFIEWGMALAHALAGDRRAAHAALDSLVGSVTEMPAAKPAKTRTRRAPRRKREASPSAAEPSPAEVVPLHAAPEEREPQVAETRSRQFGEPID